MSIRNGKDKQTLPSYQPDKNSLQSITPIDGRYRPQLAAFSTSFSEFALMRYRIQVEVEYLLFLSACHVAPKLSKKQILTLRSIFTSFSAADAEEVKRIEGVTNHDMKAIEYYLQKKCKEMHLDSLMPFVHWGITSDDTNNLAYGLALSQCNKFQMIPALEALLNHLQQMAKQNKKSVMMARTHGQPAVPTTFGKELATFAARLQAQLTILKHHQFTGKLMGAVGTLGAHRLAFPSIQWVTKSKQFVRSLGLKPVIHTTQILPLDAWVAYFQTLATINSIVKGLSADIWTYIMLEEVQLRKKEGEVGSSTMPQKVNPIDFENAEGNCDIANSYFSLYEHKLLISRLQRDLTDSVVKRTFGTALSHTYLAWKSVEKGLHKIEFDVTTAAAHLTDHYEVLAEAIQTQLRLRNDEKGYEKVKQMTRGKKITKELFQTIVSELHVENLKNLSPEKYCGYAEELASDTSL